MESVAVTVKLCCPVVAVSIGPPLGSDPPQVGVPGVGETHE
jgi:hypothetical protein